MSKGLAGVKTLTAKQIADKWKLPLAVVAKKIAAGVKVEKEHTTSTRQANEIARDHLGERPDYYDKLHKMEKTKVVKEMVSSVVQSWPNSKNIEDNRSTTGKDFASKVYHGASVVGQAYSNIKNKISPPEKPNMNPKAEPLPSSYGGKALPSKDGGSTGTGVQKDNEMSIKNIGTASKDYLTSTSISGGDRKSPTTPSNMSYTPTPGSGTSTPTTPRQAPIKEPDEVVNAQGSVFDRMNRLKEERIDEVSAKKVGQVHLRYLEQNKFPPDYVRNAVKRKWLESDVGKTPEEKEKEQPKKEVKEFWMPFLTPHHKHSARLSKKLGNKPDLIVDRGGEKGETKYEENLKEETKMDNKELINEALDCILEDNLPEMKDNLMKALQEKAIEKLEERKKEIAANYFAQ